ncbi:D-3-phosphoglycerate dehydrogenase [Desulfotomaculum arcticum]|uniref:D-3-phosphoglycerate dehydrogenase n=1 Tax=Desulfotruncus arcticus DSM 17038 TaxID=1121424 RepID=A0A1I2YFJ2_9FIRM|nr:phosphoglycerate dehydrogenase [Desulfotruncus arcticus]SFH24368.1 D-3-phosphoglycerate dehydrogenase [Desulfotomaculum arcticum] [Desulfotruncus arcticus DSM 17038]
MPHKILITSEYFQRFSDAGKKLLQDNGFEVIDNPYGRLLKEEDIIPIIKEADGIICDLEPITSKVILNAPNLKIISRRGVGVDSVDTKTAREKGIVIARTPGVVEKPVAELVLLYMLTFARKIGEHDSWMKKRQWQRELGSNLARKVLGIVGLGNIAREVIKRAKAFEMEIKYYDVFRSEEKERELGVSYVDFDQLLSEADFITIHVPLNEQTKNLFSETTLKKMKRTAFLINAARGSIVNEEDLAEALKQGIIAGAAIDVFDQEPTDASPLMDVDNVILTPHIATFTRETFIKMDVMAARNIVDYFQAGTFLT